MEAMTSIPATLRKLAQSRPDIQKDWADLIGMADAIDAHLAQPAQAVDVRDGFDAWHDAKWPKPSEKHPHLQEVADFHWRNEKDARREVWNAARALSGEKAGPVGDDADAQWALRFKAAVNAIESEEDQPMTAACGLLLIDACVERKAKTVTLNFDGVEHKDGRDLGDWTVTVECRRKAPLPASPTPDKEGA